MLAHLLGKVVAVKPHDRPCAVAGGDRERARAVWRLGDLDVPRSVDVVPQRRVRSTGATADGDRDLIVTVLVGHRPQWHGRYFDLGIASAAVCFDVDTKAVAEPPERGRPLTAWNRSNGDDCGAHGRSSCRSSLCCR
jgi:hypothetical protein